MAGGAQKFARRVARARGRFNEPTTGSRPVSAPLPGHSYPRPVTPSGTQTASRVRRFKPGMAGGRQTESQVAPLPNHARPRNAAKRRY